MTYTRALYNTRNANEMSRFVDEIPRRLIQEGTAKMETRRVPPPSQSRWQQPTRSPYNAHYSHTPGPGGIRGAGDVKTRTPAPTPNPNGVKLNIPGVQKGFNAPAAGISVFHRGDAVRHRNFGSGTVQEVTGTGAQQKVRILFEDGTERTFSATAAPIMKVNK